MSKPLLESMGDSAIDKIYRLMPDLNRAMDSLDAYPFDREAASEDVKDVIKGISGLRNLLIKYLSVLNEDNPEGLE